MGVEIQTSAANTGEQQAREIQTNAQRQTGRRRIDLTGERFGKLTAISPAENIGSKTTWLCRCDCGNELVLKTRYLRAGKIKSCADCRVVGPRGLHYIDGSCVELLRKKTLRSNNSSGATGVEWYASRNCWRVTICFQGKRHYIGKFKEFEDAVQAREDA